MAISIEYLSGIANLLGMPLPERDKTILLTIVAEYLATGERVSSARVRQLGVEVSSATIRNTMKRLEAEGFLTQPHTSAGRVPTVFGLRVYVDEVRFSEIDTAFLVNPEEGTSPLAQATAFLSQQSQFAAIALGPILKSAILRRVHLIQLTEKRILIVAVTLEGDVFEKQAYLETPIRALELDAAEKIINSCLGDRSVPELQREMRKRLRKARSEYRKRLLRATEIAETISVGRGSELLVDGSINLLGVEELSDDLDKIRSLLDTLSERERVVEILQALEHPSQPTVFMGAEIEDLGEGLSLVACGFQRKDASLGIVGVLGPSRMNYPRLIPLVDHTARVISGSKESTL